jgi:hypothetical protein
MLSDADIVRCASPWPGIAAQLLEALATLESGDLPLERICAASVLPIAPGDAEQVLVGLAAAGLCARSDTGDAWGTNLNRPEIARLVTLLRGAEHFRRLRVDDPNFELAVTMPMAPSHVERQLPASPGRPGGYLPTPTAFTRVADAAQSRLVVMTPFINRLGFDWLRGLFQATRDAAQKIIVLRDVSQYAVDLSVHHAEWLRALRVSVFDYNLAHQTESGRPLPIETFHAKIILADRSLAYVGSANLLGSGDGTSLEAGILVGGGGANQVARLVDAVLGVAKRL